MIVLIIIFTRLYENGGLTIMQKALVRLVLIIVAASLAGCTTMPNMPGFGPAKTEKQEGSGLMATSVDKTGRKTNVNVTMTGGGDIGVKSMDGNDKVKMARALDASPGKATHWENGSSGISYTVTPIRKVVIQGNPFCREYEVAVMKGEYKKVIREKACVTTDGSWHTI